VKVKGRAGSLINGTKHDFVLDSHAHPKVPVTTKIEYFLVGIDEDAGVLNLLDEENHPFDSIRFDEEEHKEISAVWQQIEDGEVDGDLLVVVSKMPFSQKSAGMQEKSDESDIKWIYKIDEHRVKDD
jgi:hypothetical protein